MQADETSKVRGNVEWLDVQKAYFIPWKGIEILKELIDQAFGDSNKRSRQAACRKLAKVVSSLDLVKPQSRIVALSFGTLLSTGERGLFIQCAVDTQIRGLDLRDKT